MLSRVDLPQPEWPMMATYSPWSILRSMRASTSLTIEPRTNDLPTPSICRNGRPGGFALGVVWETGARGAIIDASSSRRHAARGEVADQRHQPVEDEADDADVDQRHDDVGQPRGVPGVPDEEADADAPGQHFGRHDGKPRQADADAQAGEDIGGGRRDHDAPEIFRLVEAQDARHVAVVLRDVA